MVKKKPSKSAAPTNRKSKNPLTPEFAPSEGAPAKCAPIGQAPTDLAAATEEASLEPLGLEISRPDTAILLLGSPERPVLLAAAAALATYATKAPGNLDRLFDLNALDNVLALVRHEDVFARRFALKLLALMSAVRNVQAHLLRDDTYIERFTETLSDEEADVFLQEYASRILAELTSDPTGSAMLLTGRRVDPILEKLGSTDPDVRRNCLEILAHLLGDPNGPDTVFRSEVFSFGTLYELFAEPYPVVQLLALRVVELLVAPIAREDVHESFRASEGPRRLLDILDNAEWKDLFGKVVRVLGLACGNAKTAELMNAGDDTKRLVAFMEDTDEEELRFGVLGVLVDLSESAIGKKVLHNQGLVGYLLDGAGEATTPVFRATVCRGIGSMVAYPPAADEVCQGNPMGFVVQLLIDEEAEWPERQAAAFALRELLASSWQNCVNFVDGGNQVHLALFVGRPVESAPWEIQATIIQALSAMADHSRLADDLIDPELFSALCSRLDPETKAADELRIACCDALSRFGRSDEARAHLIRASLHCKIHCLLLESKSVPVLHALVNLLLNLCSADDHFAVLCTHEGCLFHMLKNHSMSKLVPTWNTCIEALFGADLSMKFAYTGRLSLTDLTPDGFHALRHTHCPFPVLEELFRLKLCPLQPIYVANFGGTPRHDSDEEDFDLLVSKCAAFNAARESMRRESYERGIRVSEGTINAWLELKFGRLQADPDLQGYLELFTAELAAIEKTDGHVTSRVPGLVQPSRIASRARLLGVFVARQLAGTDPSQPSSCLDQQLEVHLHGLRERLETNVIPLGLLRVGSYLERALLFKVMADRVALPASLVRGCNGKSWVEIAVPTVRASVVGDELPPRYLRENFIVDLMDVPGQLVPVGSSRADRYQEKRSVCLFECCEDNASPGPYT
ncbi:armadillo repeat-containing protein 3 [Copidosoma floridanum]|uniref:armadillo repeat-containing protein 3 n=1 Tax=Copidosoma floridanum TaxID=29053 RepID=UPI0006C9D5F5|nr:armadillo repeat-containing protein 3 [Copidosoma floridanum]